MSRYEFLRNEKKYGPGFRFNFETCDMPNKIFLFYKKNHFKESCVSFRNNLWVKSYSNDDHVLCLSFYKINDNLGTKMDHGPLLELQF